jgi:hypothetical protein
MIVFVYKRLKTTVSHHGTHRFLAIAAVDQDAHVVAADLGDLAIGVV